MSQQTNVPSEQQLVAVSSPVLETAKSLVIDSPMMYEMAGEELKTIKQKAKQLEDQRKAITQPMDKAKKEVMDLFRKPLEMLEQAEAVLKRSILAYTQEQRRIQQEEQRKADEAAAEERRKIEEAAKAAEKTGDVETAAVMQSAASMVVAAPVKTEAPKVAGVSTTTRWTAEVTDKVEYIKHVLAHPELIDTITIDMRPLNQMAVALKDKLSIPGIRPIANESVSARS